MGDRRGTRFKLIFPPLVFPYAPYLALPLLKACLEREGHEVEQIDLNLLFFDIYLGPKHLEAVAASLEGEGAGIGIKASLSAAGHHRHVTKMVGAAKARFAARHIVEACDVLRDRRRFYIQADYRWANDIIEHALAALSAHHYPDEFTTEGFRSAYSPFRPDEIRAFAEADNCWTAFYDHCNVLSEPWLQYDAVGISIAFADQVLAAFTLARQIKRCSPGVFICCGGNFLTRVKAGVEQAPWLFDWFDAVVTGEGEHPLTGMAAALASGRPVDDIPGLLVRREGRVRSTGVAGTMRGIDWPTPSFDGLPLERYLSPDLVLPLLTFKGCSYGKCTFCDHHVNYQELRARPPNKVAEDISQLRARYRARSFNFVDEEMPPRHAERVAEALQVAALPDVTWMGYAIYRPEWTPATWEKLSASGCREMLFGFEAASHRIRQKMLKPLDLDLVRDTTGALNSSGIASRINVIVGFPGETEAEAQASRDFFLDNMDLFDVPGTLVAFHPFLLVRNAPLADSQEGWTLAKSSARQDAFALHYAYDIANLWAEDGVPLDAEQAFALAKRFSRDIEAASRCSGYPLNRIHRFLYAAREERRALARPPNDLPGDPWAPSVELEPLYTHLICSPFSLSMAPEPIAAQRVESYEYWINALSRQDGIDKCLQSWPASSSGQDHLYVWHVGRAPSGAVISLLEEA